MTVYQLKYIPERFKSFQIDILTLATQLGSDDLIPLLMRAPAENTPLLPLWRKVSHSLSPLSDTATEIPDVSPWLGCGLLLSERGHRELKDHLCTEGEFLPVEADGAPMYLFNCLSFGKEDLELTEKKYLDGYEDGLQSLAFDESDTQNRMVFKSKMEGCGALYASSAFKVLCERLGLEGLRFDTELLSPF